MSFEQPKSHLRSKVDSGRTRHPLSEIFRRAGDLDLVSDTIMRAATAAWYQIASSEFAVMYRAVQSRTMCSNARLRALFDGVTYIVRDQIAGDLVECGCARGGSAALMALAQKRLGESRRLWLLDTFEGLPAPSRENPDYELANLFTGSCVGTIDEVRALFRKLDVDRDVQFVKGLFQDTLPSADIHHIALLHIDGDWYESVKICLETLYDKVVPGGIIQFDDYGYWQGARRAVDEFFAEREMKISLQRVDYSGRSFLKPPGQLQTRSTTVPV
jgi:hypothetical protein